MASLAVTTIELPTAALGPVSPLPMLEPVVPIGSIADDVPAEIAARARAGAPATLLPYLAQDDYGRDLAPAEHRVVVLENDHLRATVAIELGGRLLSLYDRHADRALLYANPVLQPANLALRNAWFSGGVEWNIGTRGHSPLTMDPLFAASVEGPGGLPMLRLWEWERIRGVVFQTDIWLPDSSPVLLARSRIRNLDDRPRPMYWWTNAAIAVGPGTRVLAPASRAFRTEYPDGLRVVPIPGDGSDDVTFPEGHRHAADFFFDIPPDQRPWITALRRDGCGVAHVSTDRLAGRKLFVWGTGSGGRRWQEWLSHAGTEAYAEIQAGLAPTQFEHVTMPARAEWSWTEAFAAVTVDPVRSHGADWVDAIAAVSAAVEAVAGDEQLRDWDASAAALVDAAPTALLAGGSGWGALERRRRRLTGEPWCDDTGTPFPDSSLGSLQAPWLALLDTGELPPSPPSEAPVSYVVGADWEQRLERATPSWSTEYLRAVLAHGRGDRRRAVARYEASRRHAESPWARRGLAEAARADGHRAEAASHAIAAARLAPSDWRLAVEAIARLLDDGRPHDALAFVDQLDPNVRRRGRVRMLEAWAAAGAGATARAGSVLLDGLEVADLREGERSVDQLWMNVFPSRPLPAEYDFRMDSGRHHERRLDRTT